MMARGRGAAQRVRRLGVVVVAALMLSLGVPPGALPDGPGFPVAWLWSWLRQSPGMAAASLAGLPVQRAAGSAADGEHYVPASATRAGRGAGLPPGHGVGALAPDVPAPPAVKPSTAPALPGMHSFDPATSRRVADQATEKSDTYANTDGSFTRKVYEQAVNVKGPDGVWRPIDRTLAREGSGRFRPRRSPVDVSFAGRADDVSLATLSIDSGHSASYALSGAARVAPVADGDALTYRGVFPGVDVRLAVSPSGVKESLVLASPDTGSSWVFPLRLQGLETRLEPDGSVALVDQNGKVRAVVPPGHMADSRFDPASGSFNTSHAVRYELTTVDGQAALRVSVDREWLRDPARVFPVTVDPSFDLHDDADDTFVRSDWGSTNSSGDDELLIGTYNGGTSKARSFLHFTSFYPAFQGTRIDAVWLNTFARWSYTCQHATYEVYSVTQSWTGSSTTTWPGPGLGASRLGWAAPDPGDSCTNTNGYWNVGTWMSVNLDVALFQSWALGGANYGLALKGGSETDSLHWKRFNSNNAPGNWPHVNVTYTPNVGPQVDSQYPQSGYSATTLTPELVVNAHDPNNWPNPLTYDFLVYDKNAVQIVASGWIGARTWVVPASAGLRWGETYSWTVLASDGVLASTSQTLNTLATPVPQPLVTAGLSQNGEQGFAPLASNYTTSATDASVSTVGPPLTVTRLYNSSDGRGGSAFGTGWSSALDMTASEVSTGARAADTVVVRYPDGRDAAFGRNPDGSYAPPPGRFAVFTPVIGGGYRLVDKDGTAYTFTSASVVTGTWRISSISDASGRVLSFTHGSYGPTKLTSAAGRSLTVTWSTPPGAGGAKVATVSTDPVAVGNPSTALVWTYSYTGDQLTKVCPPTSATACTTYTYANTSRYYNAVQNAGPRSYWRLGDASGTSAVSAVTERLGTDNGTYVNVTLGQPGPLAGSTAKAARFNGTSSYVKLPAEPVVSASVQSVSLWFKADPGQRGPLFGYSRDPITAPSTPSYTPALYVGTSGKLYGEFWNGGFDNIATAGSVADGAWHHVVLAASGGSQSMYLDGALVGTKNGAIQPFGATFVSVGAGFWGHSWPDEPFYQPGATQGYPAFFSGSIAEVAYFDRPLTGANVQALYQAGTPIQVLTGVVRPSGNAQASVVYDGATGTVKEVTDNNGGVWKLGTPVGSGSSQAYVAAALAGDPADYWRLAETGTTDAINRVNGNTATYSSVTLGVADGPFEDAKAASFNGTSSYLVVPSGDIPVGGSGSVSMWFKTTGSGVLYSLSDAPLPQVSGTGWNAALYVGTDGKLRGEFWNGGTNPITTSQAVNNNVWHHVVLAASANSQSLYLDGAKVGSLTGTPNVSWATNIRVGAGQWNGWPGYSGNIGYFGGQIAELAYYRSQLSDAQVAAQYAARAQTTGAPVKKVTVTDPGNHAATYAFDMADRKVAETDTLGNTTHYGYDTSGFLRTVTDPNGNVTTTEHDARGNTVSSQTCQDRSAQRCSTVYYTYYPEGPAKGFFDAADIVLSPRDFDGDGKPDVIYRRLDNQRLYLMQGNGSGGWRTGVPVEIGQGWNVADQIFSSGDFDGDGKADLIYREAAATKDLFLVRGNGSGGFAAGGPTRIGIGWGTAERMFSPGDFDGDGKPDVIYRHSASKDLYLVQGNGTGGWLTGASIRIGIDWSTADQLFSPGDFDGDGKPDVLYRRTTDTHLYLIKGNGVGGWLTGQSIQIGTYWGDLDPIFSPRDFDGDGKPDVLYKRTSTGRLYLIKGNGTGGWLTGISIDITTELPDPRNDQVLTVRDGRSTSATDNTYRTTYTYDAAGNRTKVTDPLGRDTVTAYTDGDTVAAQDGGFALAGLPMKLTTAAGAVQRVVYFRSGDVATVTDPAGKVTTFGYDGIGRVVSKTETTDSFPGGLTTTYGYDGQSRQVSQTDPPTTNRVTGAVHTAVTTTAYNVDGQVTSQTVTDSTGGDAPRTTSATYNTRGQQVTATDASGKATTFEYDNYGRPVKETSADGGVTTTSYDAEGRILASTVVGYTGDPNNPTPPTDLVVSSRAYDPAGRLASVTDAMGWVTSYTYTDNNLVAKVTRIDPSTSASFVMEDNAYDAAGNLTARIANGGVTNVTYTVDAAGRVTSSTVDPTVLNRTTSYGYSRDDHVVSTTLSDPTGVVTSTDTLYDALGRVLATTQANTAGLAPVGRWLLNETTGLTAADSAGNSSGTGMSGITWSTEHGGSAVFNSSARFSTSGPVLDTNRSYSVSAWVKLTDTSWNKSAVSQDGGYLFGFTLGYDHLGGDRWRFAVHDPNATSGPSAWVKSAVTPPPGTWAHLTGVYDQAAGQIRLYLNGTSQGTAAWSTAGVPATTGPLRIGALKWNGSDSDVWGGNIADVQVYQKALTAAEVTSVFNGSAPAAGAGVVRTSWTLDQSGLATSMTDPRGNRTDYSLDEAGRVAVAIPPAVLTEVGGGTPQLSRPVSYLGYDTFGAVVESKNPNGNVTTTAYDANGRAASTAMPAYTPPGSSTPITPVVTRTYDNVGQPLTVVDTLGKTTSFVHDQLGRVAKETAPNTGVTKYTYDLVGDVLSTTDRTGAVSAATYDYLGRRLTATRVVRQTGQNHTTTYTYGAGGWLSQTRSPTGVPSSSTYNAAGEPVTVTDGANNVTTYAYDAAGRAVRTTLADGTYATTTYSLSGQPIKVQSYDAGGALLATQSETFDPAGNMTSATDARGTTSTFSYDATGRLVSQVEPVSTSDFITSTFGYDPAGNRTRFTDGRGNAFLSTYNTWGLPESRIEPATTAFPSAADRTFTTAYDAAGRVATQYSPGGVQVVNSYDDMGNLTSQTGTGAEAATVDRVFGYDLVGRPTSFSAPGGANTLSYDDRGLLLSASGPSGSSSFIYNADGAMTSRADSAGTAGYGYDSAGRLATMSNSAAGVQASLTYNTLNQPNRITYGSSGDRRDIGYDNLHRLASDELKTSSGTSIAKIVYGYDGNGNLTSKTTTGFAGSAVNTYTYDLADRLTSWNNGTTTVGYAYDKSSNRTQAGARTFSYDQRNQLVSSSGGTSYQYTARGTLAATVGAQALATSSDAFGQVVSQQATSGTVSYQYDGLGRAVRPGWSYSGTANTLAADGTATYTRDPSGGVLGVAVGGTNRLMWADQHTDVVAQFTATGTTLNGSTSYDPWGTVLASAGMLGNLGYQSGYTESVTGRVNMWARWYNGDAGAFDTRDSAELSPTPASVNANRFGYANANPLVNTDPTGHFSLRDKLRSGWNSVKSNVNRAWNATTSFISNAWNSATDFVVNTYNETRDLIRSTARWVADKVGSAAGWVAGKVDEGRKWVASKVEQGRKWAAEKAQQARQVAKAKWEQAKQAGKVALANQIRTVQQIRNTVADVYKATENWVKEHKNQIIEVAAIGLGVLAGLACTAATAGAGAVACMVGAAALINVVKDVAQGNIHSWGDLGKSALIGGISGLAGGAGGAIGAAAGRLVARSAVGLAGSVVGRIGVSAASGAVSGAASGAVGGFATGFATNSLDQYLATGGVDVGRALRAGRRDALTGAIGGGALGAGAGGVGGYRASCHSFDPSTRVLMADGSTKPIKDVAIGEQVAATDPATGVDHAKPVTDLHANLDRDLTDLTVRDAATGKSTVLKTTQHHPFWDATERRWVDAGRLVAGHRLLVHDDKKLEGDGTGAGMGGGGPGHEVTVIGVKNFAGSKTMRDLTVADIHTYYVIAGTTPVLVHNCGGAYDWKPGNRPGLDTEPQGPLPADSGIGHGQSLAEGEHHYVVMRDGSLRAMHNDDMFGIEPSAGHTSLAGNQPVHMAGTFDVNEAGQITRFDNWSGHYGPQNMPGYTPLEDIARSAFKGHGLPAPADGAWEYHAF